MKAYIPTQAVAAYVLLAAYGDSAPSAQRMTFYIVVTAICFIASGIFIYRAGSGDPIGPRLLQATISMFAIIVWAYAINLGVVREEGWHNDAWATLALVAFTLAFGAYTPRVTASAGG